MNPKPLFVSSLIATLFAAMALEGNALSLGQAAIVLAPAGVLMVWSFIQTDWWEPTEGGKEDTNTFEFVQRHWRP